VATPAAPLTGKLPALGSTYDLFFWEPASTTLSRRRAAKWWMPCSTRACAVQYTRRAASCTAVPLHIMRRLKTWPCPSQKLHIDLGFWSATDGRRHRRYACAMEKRIIRTAAARACRRTGISRCVPPQKENYSKYGARLFYGDPIDPPTSSTVDISCLI
jgi:hypothetical protein